MKKKIGILGGAFDPIHKGHMLIGEEAYSRLGLDEIWVLPNGNPPHKTMTNPGKYNNHRLNMIKLAIRDNKEFILNTFEVDEDNKVHYSFETMEVFKDEYPDYEFYFIIGKDSLMSLKYWKSPDKLLSTTNIVAFNRDNTSKSVLEDEANELMNKFGGNIYVIDHDVLEISSSDIRKIVQNEINLDGVIDDLVLEYILNNGLYK